jgi:hypothetical protein
MWELRVPCTEVQSAPLGRDGCLAQFLANDRPAVTMQRAARRLTSASASPS